MQSTNETGDRQQDNVHPMNTDNRLSPRPERRRLARRPFTLIELMAVLLILGMIAGLAVPNVIKRVAKGKRQAAKIQVQTLADCVRDYYLDMDAYPGSLDDLVKDPGNDKWDGPYPVSYTHLTLPTN